MRPRLDSRESSVIQGEILNDDGDYSLERGGGLSISVVQKIQAN